VDLASRLAQGEAVLGRVGLPGEGKRMWLTPLIPGGDSRDPIPLAAVGL